ncbi:MAG: HAD family hydrolase [Nocardioidaceae bacterium]|nr:HAD family hydrolase [Nocardioidaceae bacterium]
MGIDSVVVDVDGTLVDSSYEHIVAWSRAFGAVGVRVEAWRLHRLMGMGGDRLVEAAAGPAVEKAVGDQVREHWRREYGELFADVRPFDGAVELLEALRCHGLQVVLATSGHPDHTARTLDILELSPDAFAIATSGEVDSTKPSSDLVEVAMEKVGGRHGLVLGDTAWDVEAAERAGMPTVALLTGGIAPERLHEAGALAVYDDPRALIGDLDGALALAQKSVD